MAVNTLALVTWGEWDHDKTAFVTRKGQWYFKVLSFGLCNAPSQFVRIMELELTSV